MRTDYPYADGDTLVLGPECFVAADGSVLCWRGQNYVPQDRDALIRIAAEALVTESCREWPEDALDRCDKPAEFVLWGKLFKPDALGPRCYNHAVKHVGNVTLARWMAGTDGMKLEAAIIDLRPVRKALGMNGR